MILDKIVAFTKKRLDEEQKVKPLSLVKSEAEAMEVTSAFAFEKALKTPDVAFICEVKKASPSKGLISEQFPYLEIAMEYEAAGANAISVLTEPHFFLGSDRYLTEIRQAVRIPLLRKDFTLLPYQIYQARCIGADGVLLICSILEAEQLKEYIRIADSLGLSCLVEAHDEAEVHMALEAGARIIGVNNRNLKTFEVDLSTSSRLRALVPKDILFVSESGIKTNEDVAVLRRNSTNAVLIGETLMRSGNITRELNSLRSKPITIV